MRRALLAVAVVALLAAPAASAAWWNGMPDALTPRGKLIEDLYGWIFLAALFFFLLVFALLVWILVRYREGGHGQATHEKHRHSTFGETVWTVGPLIVVLAVGFAAWQGMQVLDYGYHPDDADLRIKVTASRYNWEADYGGNITVNSSPDPTSGAVSEQNHFLVPAGKKIAFELTSMDIIHAFHLMDANYVTVALMDANPLGMHKVNWVVLDLPEGEYPVQCREMCLNPGHAYMRAHVRAVDQATFDAWLKEKELAVGAAFVMPIDFTVDRNGVSTKADTQLAAGGRVVARAENRAGETATLTVRGQTFDIDAGERGLFAFDVTEAGSFNVTSSTGAGQVTFTAIEAQPIAVDLGDFYIEPERLQLEQGKTYLIQVRNRGSAAHNIFIGHFDARELLATSATISGGGATSFLFKPDSTGTYDTWCDIPGHYGQGMHGKAHIQ